MAPHMVENWAANQIMFGINYKTLKNILCISTKQST